MRRTTWARGLPPLIVSRGPDVSRHRQGSASPVGSVDGIAELAYAAGAGSVVVQRTWDDNARSELLLLRRNRAEEKVNIGRARYVSLMDVATIDGRRRVLFTTFYRAAADQGETSGYLYTTEPREGRPRRVIDSSGIEYHMERASYGGELIVTSSSADLTEVFQFLQTDGTKVEGRPNPTDGLPYGEPPYLSDAVLSPDGKTLAYLEGPDYDQESQSVVGDWVLVVQDQSDGRERFRVRVAERSRCIPWMDFDGRWIVISRAKWSRAREGHEVCSANGAQAIPVVAMDSSAEQPELFELTGTVGIATIDD